MIHPRVHSQLIIFLHRDIVRELIIIRIDIGTCFTLAVNKVIRAYDQPLTLSPHSTGLHTPFGENGQGFSPMGEHETTKLLSSLHHRHGIFLHTYLHGSHVSM